MSNKKEFKPEDGKKYQPKDSMLLRAKLRLKMAKKKKMNESDIFDNVRPGDTVHYLTPQGQGGKGKVVIHGGTHVVVNRGKGQPQVVNDTNYVKHTRNGKVVGALLSRLSQVKEDAKLMAQHAEWLKKKRQEIDNDRRGEAWERVHKQMPGVMTRISARLRGTKLDKSGKYVKEMRNPAGPYGGHPYDWDPELRKQIFAAAAKKVKKLPGSPQPSKLDTGVSTYKPSYKGPPPRRGTTSEALLQHGGRGGTNDYMGYLKSKIGVKPGTSTGMPATGRPGTAAKKNATGGYHSKNTKGVERHFANKADAQKWLKTEDSRDAEGLGARADKTRHEKKKKKLHELDSSTLASYVSKAIADRKKLAGMSDQARRIHTPERAKYFSDKADAKSAKRSKGIKTAVGKIASHLPSEPLKAHSDSEGSKHGGWSGMESLDEAKKAKAVNWQSTKTKTFSVYKSTEGGMPLKHHMARLAAVGIPSRKAYSPYVGHTALEIPSKHERKASKILYGESVYIDEQPILEVSAPGKEDWIKANKQRFIARYGKEKGMRVLYAKAWKDSKTNEARENEYTANLQMAKSAKPTQKGHYLMRDGRKLSGPHSPEEAVRVYKNLGHTDSKGVKIVHVKEAADKVKKAADKAVSLSKKAKGNKHVDTEPKLDLQDKGTGGPMETNHGDENVKL